MKKILNVFLIFLFSVGFIYTSFMIGFRICEHFNYVSLNDNLQQIISEDTVLATDMEKEQKEYVFAKERYVRVQNLYKLRDVNEDLFGWIQISGSAINYPVVQNLIEPDYYLKHDFSGKKSSYGTIYMDSHCIRGKTKNYVLYGHHMKDGSMFAAINHYENYNFYTQHPIIEFDTLTGPNDYQIIGAFKISADNLKQLEKIILFNTQEDFNDFKIFFESTRFYDSGIEFSFEDEYLTLMTCEYTYRDGRFFVLAKKIDGRKI